jgi:hypothetical protein
MDSGEGFGRLLLRSNGLTARKARRPEDDDEGEGGEVGVGPLASGSVEAGLTGGPSRYGASVGDHAPSGFGIARLTTPPPPPTPSAVAPSPSSPRPASTRRAEGRASAGVARDGPGRGEDTLFVKGSPTAADAGPLSQRYSSGGDDNEDDDDDGDLRTSACAPQFFFV